MVSWSLQYEFCYKFIQAEAIKILVNLKVTYTGFCQASGRVEINFNESNITQNNESMKLRTVVSLKKLKIKMFNFSCIEKMELKKKYIFFNTDSFVTEFILLIMTSSGFFHV